MTSPTRAADGEHRSAFAARSLPAYVALVTALTVLGASSPAFAAPGKPGTENRGIASPKSEWTPEQPVAPQPEAVPPASFLSVARKSGSGAAFNQASLLPLGGGLAALAALSVLLVLRSRHDDEDRHDDGN